MAVWFNHHDNIKKKQKFNTKQLHFLVTQTLPGYCYGKQPHKPVNETDSLQ